MSTIAHLVRFDCPECHAKLKVPPEKTNQNRTCPSCGKSIFVPSDPDRIEIDSTSGFASAKLEENLIRVAFPLFLGGILAGLSQLIGPPRFTRISLVDGVHFLAITSFVLSLNLWIEWRRLLPFALIIALLGTHFIAERHGFHRSGFAAATDSEL